MKHREKKDRLLVALYEAASESDLTRYFPIEDIARKAVLESSADELWTLAKGLDDQGLIDGSFTTSGASVRLLGYGIETAEDLLEEHPEYATMASDGLAPAADRYVTLSDNQRSPVVDDLETLRNAVAQSNEGSQEDRLIALSELAAFEATLSQQRVAAELINRFVERVLKWIVAKFSEALVGAVAGALIVKLLPFLNAA